MNGTSSHHIHELFRNLHAHHAGGHRLHHDAPKAYEIYQTSTMTALLDGVYEGTVTYAQIAAHGDFGIGTFNGLDGEMVAFDGHFHHLRSDGSVAPVDPAERTPFAAVTFFRPETRRTIDHPMTRAQVESLLDELIGSRNLFHAVRIDGRFSEVVTRTVPRQTPPYAPLIEVAKTQPTFDFLDVPGTIAGFRTPDYAQGISVAGYHLHFLNEAETGGGHVLDFTLQSGVLFIGHAADLHLSLPETATFRTADLSGHDLSTEVTSVEDLPPRS